MSKRVLVTRAKSQAGEFADMLVAQGLEPVIFPVLEFVPPEDLTEVADSLAHISSYDWLLFTSANTVKFFSQYLSGSGKTPADFKEVKVCAVGSRTAESLKKAGMAADLIPERFQAEGILDSFKKIGIRGKKILFPRSEEGRDILPSGLKSLGAEVNLLTIYRTVKPEGQEKKALSILKEGIDVITFTSGSSVRHFIEILGKENRDLINNLLIACISEVTAQVAEKEGFKVSIIPEENTTDSLAEAIGKYFSGS